MSSSGLRTFPKSESFRFPFNAPFPPGRLFMKNSELGQLRQVIISGGISESDAANDIIDGRDSIAADRGVL